MSLALRGKAANAGLVEYHKGRSDPPDERKIEILAAKVALIRGESCVVTSSPNSSSSRVVVAAWLSDNDNWTTRSCEDKESVLIRNNKFVSEGTYKRCYLGVLATTSERVERVAVLITKPEVMLSRSGDYNQDEFQVMRDSIMRPILGTVPVIAIKPNTQTQGAGFQFTSISPLRASDLSFIVSNPAILSHLFKSTVNKIQNAILEAVSKFHGEGKIHRDLKPENLLLKIEASPELTGFDLRDPRVLNHEQTKITVEICDIAFVVNSYEHREDKRMPGSPDWASPKMAAYCNRPASSENELFQPSQSNDVWSEGLMLLALEDYSIYEKVACLDLLKTKDGYTKYFTILSEYYTKGSLSHFPEPEDRASKLRVIWEMLSPLGQITAQDALLRFNNIARE